MSCAFVVLVPLVAFFALDYLDLFELVANSLLFIAVVFVLYCVNGAGNLKLI